MSDSGNHIIPEMYGYYDVKRGLPYELFTSIFAVARIAGWSAHRMDEIQNAGKIIRPAYINVKQECGYAPLNDR